jgi:hypothetical protein
MTGLAHRAKMLAAFWYEYREDPTYTDFIATHDLGFPMAYASAHGLANLTEKGDFYVQETYELLLEALGLDDVEYPDAKAMLDASDGFDPSRGISDDDDEDEEDDD